MATSPQGCAVSVVVVSDYVSGADADRRRLQRTISALARQDFSGPVEHLLVVPSGQDLAEEELLDELPALRVLRAPDEGSYASKNLGVAACSGDVVALLDDDCIPEPDWLRRLVAPLVATPRLSAVSGRTTYPGDGLLDRLLALLSRAFLDPGGAGPTRFFSHNNGACRRDVYLRHPLPRALGPFASGLQSDDLLREGHLLWFEPAARVVHDFAGLAMEFDIRRNAGYGTVITRLHDRRRPYAWLMRLGVAAIPLIVAGKALSGAADCLRCWRAYGTRWYELPLALALVLPLHMLEVPGMWAAFRGRGIASSAYR
jgi:glycosyltransferase involved in cell wall biosynthesis